MRSGCVYSHRPRLLGILLEARSKNAVKALRHCLSRAVNQSGAVFGCLQNPCLAELLDSLEALLRQRTIAAAAYRLISTTMVRAAIAAALIACTSALAPQQTRTAVLEASSRRALLQRLPAALALASAPALAADVEDLAPPSQEEIEAARIARKLAAQNAGARGGERQTAAQRLAAEQQKQRQEKKKSKAEQREDLCELLGRGC